MTDVTEEDVTEEDVTEEDVESSDNIKIRLKEVEEFVLNLKKRFEALTSKVDELITLIGDL